MHLNNLLVIKISYKRQQHHYLYVGYAVNVNQNIVRIIE